MHTIVRVARLSAVILLATCSTAYASVYVFA